jgi:hypothetical protein
VPTLWGAGVRLEARHEGVSRVGEPQEKELSASPSAALSYVDGSGGRGAVLPGGLRMESPTTVCRSTTTSQPVAQNSNLFVFIRQNKSGGGDKQQI